MRLATLGVVALVSMVVLSYQACSRAGFKDMNANPAQASLSSSQESGNGNPFDGKIVWRVVDRESCNRVHAGQSIKTEIVLDKANYWLTVENCNATSAQNVTGNISRNPSSDALTYKSESLVRVSTRTLLAGTRVIAVCEAGGPQPLQMKVWETAEGFAIQFKNRMTTDWSFLLTAVSHLGIESPIIPEWLPMYPAQLESAYLVDGVSGSIILGMPQLGYSPNPVTAQWSIHLQGNDYRIGGGGHCTYVR